MTVSCAKGRSVANAFIQLFGAIDEHVLLEAGRSGVSAHVLKLARAKQKPDGKS